MSENVSVLFAFGAGLLSFLSPCVLPLIPSYLCVIGGVSLGAGRTPDPGEAVKSRLIAGTLSFILGFSAVFIVLGVLFSATFALMGGAARYINMASGIIVILLGFNSIFDFLSFLNYERRFHPAGPPRNIVETLLAGMAFGAGWTPCVGPILGSILLLAGQSGKTLNAVLYLAAYSAGLGLPFLLAAVFFSHFLKTTAKLRAHIPLIRRISAVLLIIIGLFMLTGRYQALNIVIQKWQGNYIIWAEDKALPFRLFAEWLLRLQEI
ncbi:MAG: cytochrome c biogenesis protein CcdA [Treponema sp.]|jgi:cytochrome c-type biogenesis protein|nr:cytochrome c biogenesis protein CcdA [Treponema sp.]